MIERLLAVVCVAADLHGVLELGGETTPTSSSASAGATSAPALVDGRPNATSIDG